MDFHKKNEGICTEIIFMKYKEEVQVTTTVNECLDFIQTLPLNIMHYYHETKATWEDLLFEFTDVVPSLISLFFCWMSDINIFI